MHSHNNVLASEKSYIKYIKSRSCLVTDNHVLYQSSALATPLGAFHPESAKAS
jgi:hypothetical protein